MAYKLIIARIAIIIFGLTGTLANAEPNAQNWYDNFIFKDKSFNFQLIRTLGYTYYGGADIGETLSTATAIKDGDLESWHSEWLKTANRIYALGEKMRTAGNAYSAKEAYLRASNYYRAAAFYLDTPEDRLKSLHTMGSSKESFLQAIAFLPYVKSINIPYEKTKLPGYFIRAKKANAPLLIVQTGFDGTAEELYFEAGAAAHQRGYNVLLFEGPGQGEALRRQQLYFRPDWEHVITPVIDYATKLPGVSKHQIALMGISMGGYLAARAAAFDDRIKACILNSAIYDVSSGLLDVIPQKLVQLLDSDPHQFNKIMQAEMEKKSDIRWYFNHAMWTMDAKSPAEVISKMKQYTLQGIVEKIKCSVLVVDSEDDMFFKHQAKKVYDLLKSPKTFLLFTREQTAQAHCQMGAMAISNAFILNWLDEQFLK